ncbi:MAG: Outer membrane protein MIP precursor [Verrucomicrobia bacterium ADurb.Bin118]|jgi:FKBP-type peptidyl-prolyl cis-trans isomerase FklB|nr:FKBP-type peptidyl-prolyl cis-trans isomerase [Verrucomicrobiota bacterium]OQB93275.1 MAG: Outer membrane protein MIP precursor [Verrucomicrobia bacterium ADurb.Bin118]
MKSYLVSGLACGLVIAAASAVEKSELTTPQQRTSYSLGANIGGNLKRQVADLDLDAKMLAAGVADALAGKSALSETEIEEALGAFQKEMQDKAQARQKAEGEANARKGEAFLAANAKKDGVKTTASGLQYKVLKTGTGKSPKATDIVKVHYHGTLIDGTVFDSSVQRGEPVSFPVEGVIPGWVEALQLMKEGDKWQLVIPAKLAYGEQGAGGPIGPNSTLIFEVELLAIESNPPQ